MRRIYRVDHGGEWTDVIAIDEKEALDLVKNYWFGQTEPEEFDEEFEGSTVSELAGVQRVGFICDSGERASLCVSDWMDVLPMEFSFVWGSSLY